VYCQRESILSLFLFVKGTDSIMRISTSRKPKDLLKASVPDTITLGFRASTYGFGRGHIQPITLSMNALGLNPPLLGISPGPCL